MAIFAEQQNLGVSDGNLLCGDMTGQHSKWSFINDVTALRVSNIFNVSVLELVLELKSVALEEGIKNCSNLREVFMDNPSPDLT